jgi:hypothetical protein
MKIEQKKYTHKVKVSTLRLLEKNDFNYLKTEKLTGVSRSTIKKWESQFGPEVFSGKSPGEVALKEVDILMKRNDVVIIKKYYTIRKQILDRILELIPSETRLDPLVSTLKSIIEEITVMDEMGKDGKNTSTNFIQIINEQLKYMDHEPIGD